MKTRAAAANDPEVTAKISSTGQDVRTGGPDELAATLKQQNANTAAVAKIFSEWRLRSKL